MSTKKEMGMDIEFRKKVVLTMLPIIYREIPTQPNIRGRIRDAVEMVVELAEKVDYEIHNE